MSKRALPDSGPPPFFSDLIEMASVQRKAMQGGAEKMQEDACVALSDEIARAADAVLLHSMLAVRNQRMENADRLVEESQWEIGEEHILSATRSCMIVPPDDCNPK